MNQLGKQSAAVGGTAVIVGAGSVVGKKEGEGPLGRCFDRVCEDGLLGTKSWEKAESMMQKEALDYALSAANLPESRLRCILAGDLLGQCIGSAFSMRDSAVPFLGLYGACSTMSEGLALGAMLCGGGYADPVAAITSSHFCSSERQFRFPLEYGSQRPPTAQWTVTGAGAAILASAGEGPRITHVTLGKITDAGITDVNYMGAAMAPAAYETLRAHFQDLGCRPEDYDLIVTGDLGKVGLDIVRELFRRDGVKLGNRYMDCGVMVFDLETDNVDSGGSGCGCSAVVLCGHILAEMRKGTWKDVLFCGTGALFSVVSAGQGESIPGICHAVKISV